MEFKNWLEHDDVDPEKEKMARDSLNMTAGVPIRSDGPAMNQIANLTRGFHLNTVIGRFEQFPTILEKSVKIGNIFEGRCIDIMKKVVRLEKNEFELDDGSVFPISPPLSEKISLEEFQEHYERACSAVQSIKDTGSDDQDNTELG